MPGKTQLHVIHGYTVVNGVHSVRQLCVARRLVEFGYGVFAVVELLRFATRAEVLHLPQVMRHTGAEAQPKVFTNSIILDLAGVSFAEFLFVTLARFART